MTTSKLRIWTIDYLAGALGIPADSVELDRTLDSYGLDSVEAVLMAGALEESLGVEVDPAAFLQYPTIEAMVSALENKAAFSALADPSGTSDDASVS